jgi:hypothetical protein
MPDFGGDPIIERGDCYFARDDCGGVTVGDQENLNKKSLSEELRRRRLEAKNREADALITARKTGQLPSLPDDQAGAPKLEQTSTAAQSRPLDVRKWDMKERSQEIPAVIAAPRATQTAESKAVETKHPNTRTTTTAPIVRSQSPRLSRSVLGIGIAIVVMVGFLAVLLFSGTGTQAVSSPLPTVNGLDVLTYLSLNGIILEGQEPISGVYGSGYRFSVLQGENAVDMVLFNYVDAIGAGGAMLKPMPEYEDWQRLQFGNVLLLASPDTSPELLAEVGSHLNQFIVAPHRDFLPTATPR